MSSDEWISVSISHFSLVQLYAVWSLSNTWSTPGLEYHYRDDGFYSELDGMPLKDYYISLSRKKDQYNT